MDVTTKLDFDCCDEVNSSFQTLSSGCDDDDGGDNFSDDHHPSVHCSSPQTISPRPEEGFHVQEMFNGVNDSPPYKRMRALRLFSSPATPKTLLQKCAADSSTSSVVQLPRTRSRLFKCKATSCLADAKNPNVSTSSTGSCKSSGKSSPVQCANINPFTPRGMLLSRKRSRSRREKEHSPNLEDTSVHEVSGMTDISLEECDHGDISDEDDEVCHPTKRLSLHEANVSRYHQEFLELTLIGKGEFGSVYKCLHRLDGCVYAIKKSLKPVAGSVNERIALNEVYAHAVLGKHPHVVRYYSAWAENDHMIIQNEYCSGGSLADVIEEHKKSGKSFTEAQLKQILLHVAKGLKYIHSLHLVHMDIKPGNIFISKELSLTSPDEESADDGFEEEHELDEEFEDVTYKIGDLGHVTSMMDPQVEEGDCRYLPREILQEDWSQLPKADIFALGLTLYEAALGQPLPLNGSEWHLIRDGELEDLPKISTEFQLLLKVMIHPDPRERPSAAQLVQHQAFFRPSKKTHAELRRELNAEKLKNEILCRQLQEATKCLQSINPNVNSLTVAVVSGVLAGVASVRSPSSKTGPTRLSCYTRPGPITRNSRLVGRKVNRSLSTF